MLIMNEAEIKELGKKILKYDFSNVKIIDWPFVLAKRESDNITAGGNTLPQKLRALSLIALNNNKNEYLIEQKPRFSKLGAMIDMSRGGVMRVERIKEYIARLAFFGANELLLYTEDIYTLEEYPHFGYLRGAYTDDELLEIDNYANQLGVEITPCIQTLGHMCQYLSWTKETEKIKDTTSVLMCDNEATYQFIEAEISKMRKLFRSKKIHIGMDEAHDVGLGKYLRQNGYVNRFDLLKRHLSKVVDICQKYDFEPMMWSDMFFRIGSPTGSYYHTDGKFPENFADDIPNVSMVYWDYYSCSKEFYSKMISRHFELKKPIVFAGGLWTWSGFLPEYTTTNKSMIPAMRSCIENGISHVFATIWGDDGCETDYFRALYSFGIFSEYCYLEHEPEMIEIEQIGEIISGISSKTVAAIAKFHETKCGKHLIWGDIFFNLIGIDFSLTEFEEMLSGVVNSGALNNDKFAEQLFKIASLKVNIYKNLQSDYKSGKSLYKYTHELLPELISNYKKLFDLHTKNWRYINKPFGFEKIEARYAATIERIRYAKKIIEQYEKGKEPKIEELEYMPIYGECRGRTYDKIAWSHISI